MKNIPSKIRNDPLWKDGYALAEHIYGKMNDLIADFPEEQWYTASKLRMAANDSLFHLSQAIGNYNIESSQHDWNGARKNLFALQSMYTFAAKQKFIVLEPETIVKIDEIISEIDKRIVESKKGAVKRDKEELEPWLKKYRIWQEIEKPKS